MLLVTPQKAQPIGDHQNILEVLYNGLSKKELFQKLVNDCNHLTVLAKISITDPWQGPKYTLAIISDTLGDETKLKLVY